MKYIITENKLEKMAIKFLNTEYGDLEVSKSVRDNRTYFRRDGRIIMEKGLDSGYIWVRHDAIWSDLERIFDLDHDGVTKVIKKWVDDKYNIQAEPGAF
jgi:hypothetical protein